MKPIFDMSKLLFNNAWKKLRPLIIFDPNDFVTFIPGMVT